MSRILTATEVKVTILALLDDVAAGDEVEITKHGRVVARLVPAPRSAPDPRGARWYRAEHSGRRRTLHHRSVLNAERARPVP
ncbi:MAG: type II toxin-antitoxin system prevent-host-death family antitoxin [Gemmatimonadota bacterium]|nr:type II toxin-antitoxin system prevent-host-death family antitoxin [Gemmatimonadota bacterium]